MWAHGDEVYLDLNCRLSRRVVRVALGRRSHAADHARSVIAGRNLTSYLRQRFAIAPEMCVTHGLTSVNPRQHLIGYHRDWARGFPFEAFGLPDLYALAPPSITLFGFSYDDEYLRTVGPWEGLAAANEALEREAKARSMSVTALRAERRRRINSG